MFFRAASRAVTSSVRNSTRTALYARQFPQQQIRCASSEHAIANPEIAGIEKRWEAMPPQEQAELWMKLRDRMKVDWKDMTLAEKKAGTFCPRLFSMEYIVFSCFIPEYIFPSELLGKIVESQLLSEPLAPNSGTGMILLSFQTDSC